jgi:hypothetical protein
MASFWERLNLERILNFHQELDLIFSIYQNKEMLGERNNNGYFLLERIVWGWKAEWDKY